jgi:predicted amidohydrolase
MALAGAEILLYPTAIGSEPHDASIDSRTHWQNFQRGHAAANLMPLVASNRVGTETGEKIVQCNRTETGIITAEFDLDALALKCRTWGVSATGGPSAMASSRSTRRNINAAIGRARKHNCACVIHLAIELDDMQTTAHARFADTLKHSGSTLKLP